MIAVVFSLVLSHLQNRFRRKESQLGLLFKHEATAERNSNGRTFHFMGAPLVVVREDPFLVLSRPFVLCKAISLLYRTAFCEDMKSYLARYQGYTKMHIPSLF